MTEPDCSTHAMDLPNFNLSTILHHRKVLHFQSGFRFFLLYLHSLKLFIFRDFITEVQRTRARGNIEEASHESRYESEVGGERKQGNDEVIQA